MTKRIINKKKVSTILNNLSVLTKDNPPVDSKGNLDVVAFNELKETKLIVKELKKLHVGNKWLFENGFTVAAMILRMYEK